jgi:integrase
VSAIVRKETCELTSELAAKARRYAFASISKGTRDAYRHDFRIFSGWCERFGYSSLPASVETVTLYLAEVSGHYRPKYVSRILSGLGYAHRAAGFSFDRSPFNPILKGISHTFGIPSKQAAGITIDQLRSLIVALPDTLLGARDRVVLTLGFAAALRPSELVGLNIGRVDSRSLGFVEINENGLRVTVRRTHGDNTPIVKAIPRGGSPCPVETLERWLALAAISHGPILRKITASGVLGRRVHHAAVSKIIRAAVYAEGLRSGLAPAAARDRADRFSGYSLRVGFVTSAVRAGASSESIARHVGWKSVHMVGQYRRRAGLFHKHPVERVLAS